MDDKTPQRRRRNHYEDVQMPKTEKSGSSEVGEEGYEEDYNEDYNMETTDPAYERKAKSIVMQCDQARALHTLGITIWLLLTVLWFVIYIFFNFGISSFLSLLILLLFELFGFIGYTFMESFAIIVEANYRKISKQ
ncbi:MAG: hypothetical protein LBN04_10595 [Oscillospiraceae bacterium]|nr:hypothetical protein [Oscillospiraceae bacterium]